MMLESWISPSLMCADLLSLGRDIERLEAGGCPVLHFDVMDGHFVPNLMLGTALMGQVRRAARVPFDIHLMVERPEEKLGWFGIRPGDWVTVHAESTAHLQRALAAVRALGAHPGVALNPATPLSALKYVLPDMDMLLLMTVNPGYAGQKLVPSALGKIAEARAMLDAGGRADCRLEVDGNVSFDMAPRMREKGADTFVAGSSSVFSGEDIGQNCRRLLKSLR